MQSTRTCAQSSDSLFWVEKELRNGNYAENSNRSAWWVVIAKIDSTEKNKMTSYQKPIAEEGSTQEAMNVVYTAKTHTSGGRRGGVSHSDDDRLDLKFSAPGVPGTGTNPEQLFAAGWSACFISAMGLVASKMKVKLPADVAVDAEIDLCNSGSAYFLQARLNVSLPGLEREVAQAIVEATHGETCAYSNATRGNVDVTLNLV
jgi:lipoyl-dependent peroxiredoxin